MVVAIKYTLELVTAILADGFPYICRRTIECIFTGKHRVGVQPDVCTQLVVLILGQIAVGIGQLGQISQLGTIINNVRICLGTSTAGKDDRALTVPYITCLNMRRILWGLPATVLTNLLQAGDVRIVAQDVLKWLTHAGSEVCGVHLDGMLAAEVFLRSKDTTKILIGIDIEHAVVRSPYCCCPLHCREAVTYRAASGH